MNNLVSIIMPSYNTAMYIKESIDSVLEQTYTNFELIIVDDASNDATDSIIHEYQDSRIVYLKNDANQGAAMCRNRGIKEAKGKWIAFLDSDDVWVKNKLEKQIRFMEEHDYHFSYTCYEEMDEDGELLHRVICGPKHIAKSGMYNFCWPGCLTVMYDASYVGEIQIEPIRKNNDYLMWLEIVESCDCFLLDEVLAVYRRRSGSISNHSSLEQITWYYRMFHEGLHRNMLVSILLTIRNCIFALYKKMRYVKEK